MIYRNVQMKPLVMWLILCLSIIVTCDTLKLNEEFPSHLETNKINKGIWLRHRHRTDDRQHTGHFFRSNSNEDEPFANALSVINRDKRSGPSKTEKRYIKNVKAPKKEQDVKTSVFNNLPLRSMLLEDSSNKHIDYNGYNKYDTKTPLHVDNETNELTQAINSEYEKVRINENDNVNYFKDLLNVTEGNTTTKRSMKYDQLIVDRIDLLEVPNKTKDIHIDPKINEDQMWQSAPVPDKNLYELPPKDSNAESQNPKPVTERGLIKVVSMLTRTFQKIMKQHNEIKMIHEQMNKVNKEFGEKIGMNTKKLNDFDVKYKTIMQLMEKLSHIQDCLKNKEENLKKKEQVMSKNMLDFESQQNKFLTQQQHFYNIQKIMLLQNEKMNEKQNTIAKMQSEISHRQNHFAKILQKVKQNIKNHKTLKLNTNIAYKNNSETYPTTTEPKITTEQPTSIEPVKINLLNTASNNVIENQDKMILKEKDDKSVDDLIYKYYFNNTFIDTVIRNKILGGITIGDKTSIARSAKLAAKRNHQKFDKNATKLKTTLLFPVIMKSLNRQRRWINHHSTRKHRKRHPSKGNPDQSAKQSTFETSTTSAPKILKESDVIANDPFLAMATNFCMQIGQSTTKQILDWCVEKALRRLRSLDRKMMPPPASVQTSPQPRVTKNPSTVPPVFKTTLVTSASPLPTHPPPTVQTPPAIFLKDQTQNAETKAGLYENQFFPDNQELESNLKQFDLTPDTAGNVYYEGSLHASDMLPDKSEGVSDILPGLDSNSKIDIDPGLITLQLRRKYMRQNTAQKLWKN